MPLNGATARRSLFLCQPKGVVFAGKALWREKQRWR